MGAAFLDISAKYPEVLGELPFFSDQAAICHDAGLAPPRFRCEEDDLASLIRQNDQLLWATLGTWDL